MSKFSMVSSVEPTKRYFIDNSLVTSDEKKFVVFNQWGIENIGNFINKVRELGYESDPQ